MACPKKRLGLRGLELDPVYAESTPNFVTSVCDPEQGKWFPTDEMCQQSAGLAADLADGSAHIAGFRSLVGDACLGGG